MGFKKLFYKNFHEHDSEDWTNGEAVLGEKIFNAFGTCSCPNCSSEFDEFIKPEPPSKFTDGEVKELWLILLVCRFCGWWQLTRKGRIPSMGEVWHNYQYHSILQKIELETDEFKMIELKKALINDWDYWKKLSPGKTEDIVQDILREHLSCDVFHTTANVYASDGGIDLYIAHNTGGIKMGIQVKRRLNNKAESVSEVRNFVGALTGEGANEGIFVTTAERFSSKALIFPQKLEKVSSKIKLELIASERLLELIKAYTPSEIISLPFGLNENSLWLKDNKAYTSKQVFESTLIDLL